MSETTIEALIAKLQAYLIQSDSTDAEGAAEQAWKWIDQLDELEAEVDRMPYVAAILARAPDHNAARFRRGTLLLERDDEGGVADVEAAMAGDHYAIPAGCRHLSEFYEGRDATRAQDYAARADAHEARLERIEVARREFVLGQNLKPATVSSDIADRLMARLAPHRAAIDTCYLVRRILDAELDIYDTVLVLLAAPRTSGAELSRRAQEIAGGFGGLRVTAVDEGRERIARVFFHGQGIAPLDLGR